MSTWSFSVLVAVVVAVTISSISPSSDSIPSPSATSPPASARLSIAASIDTSIAPRSTTASTSSSSTSSSIIFEATWAAPALTMCSPVADFSILRLRVFLSRRSSSIASASSPVFAAPLAPLAAALLSSQATRATFFLVAGVRSLRWRFFATASAAPAVCAAAFFEACFFIRSLRAAAHLRSASPAPALAPLALASALPSGAPFFANFSTLSANVRTFSLCAPTFAFTFWIAANSSVGSWSSASLAAASAAMRSIVVGPPSRAAAAMSNASCASPPSVPFPNALAIWAELSAAFFAEVIAAPAASQRLLEPGLAAADSSAPREGGGRVRG